MHKQFTIFDGRLNKKQHQFTVLFMISRLIISFSNVLYEIYVI